MGEIPLITTLLDNIKIKEFQWSIKALLVLVEGNILKFRETPKAHTTTSCGKLQEYPLGKLEAVIMV